MKQLFQDLRDGETVVENVPRPGVTSGSLLVRTTCSLVSAGTEKMLVEFGRANLIGKARAQPEKVRQVIDKVATDGLAATIDAVRSKLDQPLALGYCNVGIVSEVGAAVSGIVVGDRVVSNGPHAEYVAVPRNLVARIPDAVSDEEAAFAVVGAIALQGVRLAEPTLGECFVVIGLGLVGLLAVQILQANGCRVLGVDPDSGRVDLARKFGAEVVESASPDALKAAEVFSRGCGVDGVIVTAATESSQPISDAARMCRKRGRIVLVGVTGLELNRADFYEKELTFQVSCSYGPGRYDRAYEEQGLDYPVAFVRWTEQRNIEAVLDMMALSRIDVRPLITHRFAFSSALDAYDLLVAGREPSVGILLTYPSVSDVPQPADATITFSEARATASDSAPVPDVVVGVIGAGNYAGRVLLPALARHDVSLRAIASLHGTTASHYGKKHGFSRATTDLESVLDDDRINTVVIATRHDSHASLVCRALAAGKHVFVEKPLGLTLDELDEIEAVYATSGRRLCVGFNRRFAPLAQRAHALARARSGPLAVVMTVNAGGLPPDHWARDPRTGGGRVLGEGCHFLDLARFLVGYPLQSLQASSAAQGSDRLEDVSMMELGFEDGSIASIQYLANGHPRFPKERVELFWDSKVLRIDNFRRLRGWGVTGTPFWKATRQDKGHAALLAAFVEAVRDGSADPIPVAELLEVSRWSIRAGQLAAGADSS